MRSEERLLADVLRTGDYENFQESVRGAMVAAVRARKLCRRKQKFLAMAACLAVLGTTVFFLRDRAGVSKEMRPHVTIVRTEAFPAEMVVRSELGVEAVRSAPEVAQIQTAMEAVATITDEQLLKLFKDRPVAIVRIGNEVRLMTPSDGGEVERQ